MNSLVIYNQRVHPIICLRTVHKRVTEMEKDKIIILVEKENLNPEKLRSVIDVDGCGSVVSFVGLTRGEDNAIKVKRLEFDAWENKLHGKVIFHILQNLAFLNDDVHRIIQLIYQRRVCTFLYRKLITLHVAYIHQP